MKEHDKTELAGPGASPAHGGFTMVEMLVVMFVITMLLTIGVPAIIKIRTQSKINACQTTVNIIHEAVKMYHGQHKRYPAKESMPAELYGQRFGSVEDGPNAGQTSEVNDYCPGYGYRLQPRGPIYGPWNGVDKLKRSGEYDGNARVFFLDAFGRTIWYCPFKVSQEPGEQEYHDPDFDTASVEPGYSLSNIADYAKNESGRFYRRDYILMSQSADGRWGKPRGPDPTDDANAPPTDDVTNFTN